MLRVLHLLNYCGKGGSESYILSLFSALKDKCEFYLAYSEPGPMLKKVEALGIKTILLPMRSPYDIGAAIKLKSICNKMGVDLIHTHFLRENFIAGFAKMLGMRGRLINTVHMLEEKTGIIRTANKFFSGLNSQIIAVSNAVKTLLISEGINQNKIASIPNGVDTDFWRYAGDFERAATREQLGIGQDNFVSVSVARFREEKGHHFLLDSILSLKNSLSGAVGQADLPKIKFLLAGDGPILDDCKRFCAENGLLDDVIFLGQKDDVKSLLCASDIFICHSKSEALGLSLLEAMACSLPVIATASGGPTEILDSDPSNINSANSNMCESNAGILIKYGDCEAMSNAIYRFNLDREFLSSKKTASRKTVEDRFDLQTMSEETYRLYLGKSII